MNVILGTGPLGMSVMRELAAQGEPVTMVSLSGKAVLPPGVRAEKADLMDKDQARAALKKAKVVFQCAQPPYHKWDTLFLPFQDHVAEAAMAAGAKLVAAENVYMYGQVDGIIEEGLPYAAATRKGKVRAEMSRRLLQLHGEGKLQAVMARGADFFGPDVRGSSVGLRFFQPIVKGKPCTVLGNPDKKHTFTYVEDFGKALVALSRDEGAFGRAWHVPNAPTVTTRAFAEAAYRVAGFPPAIRTMGKGMLRFGGLFIPEARESIEMLYQFEHDFIVDSSAFAKRFGLAATPLDIALARTLASPLLKPS